MSSERLVLGVIPARGGSKGVPGKNIRMLGDLPLMSYTIRAAKESRINTLVVSTEDKDIAAVARDEGVRVIARPPELAQDKTPTLPVIAHVLSELSGETFDAVFTLQVTTPFRSGEDIDRSIDQLFSTGASSVIGVVPVGDAHPARVKRIVDGRLEGFYPEEEGSRRQDLPPAYLRNGAVYLTRTETVVAGSLLGAFQSPYVMPKERSVNIDEEIDFLLAETLLTKGQR